MSEFVSSFTHSIKPSPDLIKEMRLDCDYKNFTYAMLNDEDFVEKVKEKYPELEKLYEEEDALKIKESL